MSDDKASSDKSSSDTSDKMSEIEAVESSVGNLTASATEVLLPVKPEGSKTTDIPLQEKIKAKTQVAMLKKLGTANVGSATGNPRNKVALRPGHSLMDWVRLGNSGRDLTGVGGIPREVAASELVKHNRQDDAWLAIKGRVYNVTHYMDFHPGGVEELMRGAGRDATSLFNEVHAWVNFESILQKCVVGPLRGGLLFSAPTKPRQPLSQILFGKKAGKTSPAALEAAPNTEDKKDSKTPVLAAKPANPRLDWFQQLGNLTLVLYARMIPRTPGRVPPWVRVKLDDEGVQTSVLVTTVGGEAGVSYEARLRLHEAVQWPLVALRSHNDSGKVEVVFKKVSEQLWPKYGDTCEGHGTLLTGQNNSTFWPAHLVQDTSINYNTKLLVFMFTPRVSFNIPIGHHIRVQAQVEGMTTARSYTPVLPSLTATPLAACDNVCLMVKSYQDGALSPLLCSLQEGASIEISEPVGTFDVRKLSSAVRVLLVAAGTGLTPMVRIINQVLQDPRKVCTKVKLLFFNKTSKDILWRQEMEELTKADPRFEVEHVLSEEPAWLGRSGRVRRDMLESLLVIDKNPVEQSLQQSPAYMCVCGPEPFTQLSKSLLLELGLQEEAHFHCFLG